MGSVADKIARKLLSFRGSKVVDLAGWREGRKMALEAGFGGEGPILARFADLDPCHGIYALAENIASLMAESISGMREAKGFVRIVGEAEDEYLPSGPPMSPLTVSYFAMWAFFDVRFGSSRETMGSCILRIAPEFDCPSWLIDTVERMQRSRMGFYVHCGSEGEGVLLREVGTREVVSCMVPAGYAGHEGEIWFVRVLPPPPPPVPPAYRDQHALRHPGLARRRLHRLPGARARADEGEETAPDGRPARLPDEVRPGPLPLERIRLLRVYGSSA